MRKPATGASVPAGWLRTPRIFVVDDERVIADTLAKILCLNGHEAMPMYTSTAALEHLSDDDYPDLLITDVALDPDSINGIDLAIYFERECPECKVLLISGHAETASLYTRARQAGHEFPLMQKPIRPEQFLATVSDLLADLRLPEEEESRPAA